jgi:hypothetical protein
MNDILDLEERVEKFITEFKEIIDLINHNIDETSSDLFMKAKQIETTITIFQKMDNQIPDELTSLKQKYLKQIDNNHRLITLKKKMLQLIDIYIPPRRSNINKSNRNSKVYKQKKSLYSFSLFGEKYSVHTWKDLLDKSLTIILSMNPDKIENIFQLRGSKIPWFSRNKNDFVHFGYIPKYNLYYNAKFSANDIVRLVHRVLDLYGYSQNDLKVNTHEN